MFLFCGYFTMCDAMLIFCLVFTGPLFASALPYTCDNTGCVPGIHDRHKTISSSTGFHIENHSPEGPLSASTPVAEKSTMFASAEQQYPVPASADASGSVGRAYSVNQQLGLGDIMNRNSVSDSRKVMRHFHHPHVATSHPLGADSSRFGDRSTVISMPLSHQWSSIAKRRSSSASEASSLLYKNGKRRSSLHHELNNKPKLGKEPLGPRLKSLTRFGTALRRVEPMALHRKLSTDNAREFHSNDLPEAIKVNTLKSVLPRKEKINRKEIVAELESAHKVKLHEVYNPSDEILSTTLSPTNMVEEVSDSDVNRIPDPSIHDEKEELEEAIKRDATLIIIFSVLAAASFAMWRIVRCIVVYKLNKYEKKSKDTTV